MTVLLLLFFEGGAVITLCLPFFPISPFPFLPLPILVIPSPILPSSAMLGHQDGQVDFEVAYTQLATCTAGHHVRKARVRRLVDMITSHSKIHSLGMWCCAVLWWCRWRLCLSTYLSLNLSDNVFVLYCDSVIFPSSFMLFFFLFAFLFS